MSRCTFRFSAGRPRRAPRWLTVSQVRGRSALAARSAAPRPEARQAEERAHPDARRTRCRSCANGGRRGQGREREGCREKEEKVTPKTKLFFDEGNSPLATMPASACARIWLTPPRTPHLACWTIVPQRSNACRFMHRVEPLLTLSLVHGSSPGPELVPCVVRIAREGGITHRTDLFRGWHTQQERESPPGGAGFRAGGRRCPTNTRPTPAEVVN